MDIARAAELLEACAFDPDGAPAAFDAVCDALDLRFFHLTNLSGPAPEHLTGERSGYAVEEYLREGVIAWDTWTQGALRARPKADTLFVDEDLVSDADRNGDYYRDYCPRHDVAHHGGWVSRRPEGDMYFAIFRGAAQGEFTATERAQLTQLIPAANRTLDLLANARKHRSVGVAKGLEAAGRQCLLVDAHGRVSYVTPNAEPLFDGSFGIRNGALFAADAASHRRLALVAAVAQGRIESALLPNIIVRRADRRPLVLALSPIRGVGLDALPGARLVITMTDLERSASFDTGLAQALFGMTSGEIEVATLLVNGGSAETIAAARGVRPTTVRQMIKAMLTKSGTHRQAELVALLCRLSG